MPYPPEYGPLAAVTPGTPGGLMVMLAEYGTLSLADVLAPAIQMAEGYPIEAPARQRRSSATRSGSSSGPTRARSSCRIRARRARRPRPGEIFRAAGPRGHAEEAGRGRAAGARRPGKSRKRRILAAYERFYRGDIAEEFVRGSREQGGLVTMEDLARLEGRSSRSRSKTSYKGIDVYKLDVWTQGPAMLQALNILETLDLKAMGYNSARYIHALYQAMNLAFADRDFYYGDPDFPPAEPRRGPALEGVRARRGAKLDRLGRRTTRT